MNLINEAYCNDKDKKLWINGEQKQRIGSVEQANEMIPNMYVTRNQSSNEIIGIIVAKISDDNGVVIIGPVAIKPKFQACSSTPKTRFKDHTIQGPNPSFLHILLYTNTRFKD